MKYRIMAICLLLVFASSATGEDGIPTGIFSGKWISTKYGIMTGGFIFLFNAATGPPPDPERYWRVPDKVTIVDTSGAFSVELPEGEYYLGPLKRKSTREPGPPEKGDIHFFSREKNGDPKIYQVTAGKTTDVGTIREANPFKPPHEAPNGITAIEGKVTDADGKPLAGALVFGYFSPDAVGKPLFVSEKADKNGIYRLRVSEGGEYYLKTRTAYGSGMPETGELVGTYGGTPPLPVRLDSGSVLKGIDIQTHQFKGEGEENKPYK